MNNSEARKLMTNAVKNANETIIVQGLNIYGLYEVAFTIENMPLTDSGHYVVMHDNVEHEFLYIHHNRHSRTVTNRVSESKFRKLNI